jgi:exopolysaccharide production protein ExoZ
MQDRLVGVQYLRAFAALAVLFAHLSEGIPAYESAFKFHGIFDTDRVISIVDIFFVISGFILVVISRWEQPLRFLWWRAIRILPLYWTLTLGLGGLAIIAPTLFHSTHATVAQIVKSMLFIPYANPDRAGELYPVLVPGWTLNIETYFYLIFALLLLPALRARQPLALTVIFFSIALAHLWPHPRTSLFWFYTQPRVLDFWAGAMIGYLYLSHRIRVPALVSSLVLLVGFLGLFSSLPWRDNFVLGSLLPATLMIAGMVWLEPSLPNVRLFSLLGDASYSLYLTHIFVLVAIRAFWPTTWPAFAYCATVMVAAFAVAIPGYYLFELPSLRALRRASVNWSLLRKQAAPPAAIPAAQSASAA